MILLLTWYRIILGVRNGQCGSLAAAIANFAVSMGVPTLFITVPNGFVRVISFDGGKVSPASAVTSFEFSREDDSTRVKVNGMDENYVIPDAVITGG